MADYDVIVVGAGNAALAASVSARNSGAERVLVLEKASEDMRGGNTHYSGGLLRIAFDHIEEILRLVPQARELEGFVEGIDPYPAQSFWSDLRRMTSERSDPELAQILISKFRAGRTVPRCWPRPTVSGAAWAMTPALAGHEACVRSGGSGARMRRRMYTSALE